MKKLLFTIMAVVLCVGLMGSVFAYFTDTETSTNNNLTSGTLDLQLSNGGGWVDDDPNLVLSTASNMAPGVEVGPYDVWFKNNGTMDGKVRVTFSYVEYDDPNPYGEFSTGDVSANAYAKKLIVTKAYLDTDTTSNKAVYWPDQIVFEHPYTDMAAAIADGAVIVVNSVNLPTIYGLSLITLKFTDAYPAEDVWSPSEYHYENFYLQLDSSATSVYAFDGINITLSATLTQTAAP